MPYIKRIGCKSGIPSSIIISNILKSIAAITSPVRLLYVTSYFYNWTYTIGFKENSSGSLVSITNVLLVES